ncbi:hypothetical protein T459_22842 [Capsicum annuum]|uniref:Uncharacterized protein n=1 Tax=Capsicum annuum TaxID=4072 RepID=A0A2G2YQM4_CAPAN|nr:hypothetical protein FXO37_28746 [Capsicum annuum]PHT72057.1 hypothetical protein T459_22842 [Capsicum annuum]
MEALKEEIKFTVKMFRPATLSFTIKQARMQEKAIEAALKKAKPVYKPSSNVYNARVAKGTNTPNVRPNVFRVSPEVYEYRKINHLCFKCGDKYSPGHQCKMNQLQCITREIEEMPSDQINNPEIEIEGELNSEIQEVVCLNALSESNLGVNPILVGGTKKNKSLSVLVDSGATHSFIDEQTVRETGHHPLYSHPIRVTVADGNYVYCSSSS